MTYVSIIRMLFSHIGRRQAKGALPPSLKLWPNGQRGNFHHPIFDFLSSPRLQINIDNQLVVQIPRDPLPIYDPNKTRVAPHFLYARRCKISRGRQKIFFEGCYW
jgi:hypothetical protein